MSRDRDEEGEYIYDPDEQQYERDDRELSQERDFGDWEQQEAGGESAGEDEEAPKAKPRKRLVKKSAKADVEEEDEEEEEEEEYEPAPKRRSKDSADGEQRRKSRKLEGKDGRSKDGARHRKSGHGLSDKGGRLSRAGKGEKDMNEMWDTVVGQDSEDDAEGLRTRDDDNFIDDTGVQYMSDGDEPAGSAGDAPQAEEGEEDDELKKYFQSAKKRNKKHERPAEEVAMLIEQFMARLEVAAEDDANCNRRSQPAINKLKMLPELILMLEKRQLQQEFLDRGVLSVLKNWLEPLPDGCLPNLNIRTALLKLLTDLPIDVEQYERRDQLKKSGLGKVVMFLSKLPEESPTNKKLARDLVDRWSRPLFAKSTRYEDLRQMDSERTPVRRPMQKKPVAAPRRDSRAGDELEMDEESQEPRPGESGFRFHASRPEALALDFVVRPDSKIDPETVRARAKALQRDEKRQKMNKKLQNLKTPKRRNLQAERISVEGRGLAKFY